MCIAYLALGTDPNWPLFIAANRDEFHARPTRPTAPWEEAPAIIGGKDIKAGGTWFAVQRQGRFALLTNYRDMQPATGLEHSRGNLCKDFLLSSPLSAEEYMHHVSQQALNYQGFNLIVGQWCAPKKQFDCYYFSNRGSAAPVVLESGHYVLSNHLLNTAWPKSQRLHQRLKQHVQHKIKDVDAAYKILKDDEKAPLQDLPSTGLDPARELLVSSPFIISPEYGTRSSSVWLVDKNGYSRLNECSYNPAGVETERHSWPILF